MSAPPRPQFTGLSSATSPNGTAREGATLVLDFASPLGLLVLATSDITTASVIATFKMQVSNDETTWYDLKLPNNAANVATAAGTGAPVVTTLALSVPPSAFAAKFFRVVATLSGASTDPADLTAVVYQYIPQGYVQALL